MRPWSPLLANRQVVCAYILDEAAVDLVTCANKIVVLRHFDDHPKRERLSAAGRSVVAKAAAAERSKTHPHTPRQTEPIDPLHGTAP
jgi:hypothetical protein